MYVHPGRHRCVLALKEHADGVGIFFGHVALNTVLFQLRNSQFLGFAEGIGAFPVAGHTPV